MRNYLRVKNWEEFQQYKDRDPKWIKLHRDILTDYDFDQLTEVQQNHLMKIWLLASKLNNKIPNDPAWIGRQISAKSKVDINQLLTSGFLVLNGDTCKTRKGGFVYFVRAEKTNRIKIGYSSRLRFRLDELRRAEGEPITLMGAFPGTRGDESGLHDKFSEFYLKNEWFTYNDNIVYTCVRMCTQTYLETETEAYKQETEAEAEDCSEQAALPLSENGNGLDENLMKILKECPNLNLVSTGMSSEFWDQVLAACEPYPMADAAWLNAKIRSWNVWFESNKSRKSVKREKLEARLFSWLSRDLEQMARRR